MREFRVKKVVRYIVTDWEDYTGSGSVSEIAEAPNVQRANEIAEMFGRAHPEALVNLMAPEPESYGLLGPAPHDSNSSALSPHEQALRDLPYNIAAARRRLARATNDVGTLVAMDNAGVAVDA